MVINMDCSCMDLDMASNNMDINMESKSMDSNMEGNSMDINANRKNIPIAPMASLYTHTHTALSLQEPHDSSKPYT